MSLGIQALTQKHGMTLASRWATMVVMRRFRWLAVVAVTLVVFGVSLAALLKGPPPNTYTAPTSAASSTRSIASIASESAAQFVDHTVGVPNSKLPSFWTNSVRGGPDGLSVSTGKVIVRGKCAAVDFDGSGGAKTAILRHPYFGSQWVPERIISGGNQFETLDPTAHNCS